MLKLNPSIADTSRQSYMCKLARKLACGIRRHQNCRIGPSLEYGWKLNRMEDNIEIRKHIYHYPNIYPWLVELELARTIVAYRCTWETSYLKRDWHYSEELWEKLSSVIDNDWIWIWTLNSSYTFGWIDTTTPSSHVSSSGNDIGVIFVDVHRVFDTLCTTGRVRSVEKQLWLLLPSTPGLPDCCIMLLGCQK